MSTIRSAPLNARCKSDQLFQELEYKPVNHMHEICTRYCCASFVAIVLFCYFVESCYSFTHILHDCLTGTRGSIWLLSDYSSDHEVWAN